MAAFEGQDEPSDDESSTTSDSSQHVSDEKHSQNNTYCYTDEHDIQDNNE